LESVEPVELGELPSGVGVVAVGVETAARVVEVNVSETPPTVSVVLTDVEG